MPSSELKQLERELEVAAVQFSIAERTSTLTKADQAQSTSVSEARVLSAARNALANDDTAPIERILDQSAAIPVEGGHAGRQWTDFLGRVRRQLRSDTPAATRRRPAAEPIPADWGPLRPGRRQRWAPRRTTLGLGVGLVVLVLGGLAIAAGGWLLNSGECQGPDCSPALEAVATTAPSPTTAPDRDSTTLPVGDGQEAPRGGISVGDPESETDATGGEETASPTTTAAGGATTESGDPASGSTSTDAGSAATTNPPASSTTTTTRGTPATTAPGNARAASSTTTTAAPTTTTVAPTTTAEVAPDPAPVAAGVACPTGVAVQRLNVTGVADNDVLNIRLGPGTSFTIVAALAHDATGVRVYGAERSGAWVKIVLPGMPAGTPPANGCGWVHASFLGAAPTPV